MKEVSAFPSQDLSWKLHVSFSLTTGQNLARWPHLAVREARKCHLYRCLASEYLRAIDRQPHPHYAEYREIKIYIAFALVD